MTWTDGATWVGTIVTIISTIIAIWQANKAKQSATKAEEMRNDIAKRSAHSELSGLNGALGAAIRAMDKYGPGTGRDARRGSSPDSDAAAVRALTSEMTRLRILLTDKFGQKVMNVISNLNQLLSDFAAAPNESLKVQHGCNIYKEIVEFSGNIKKELDEDIYRKK